MPSTQIRTVPWHPSVRVLYLPVSHPMPWVDPTGRFLYTTDGAANQLIGYTISSSGALTPMVNGPFKTDFLPNAVTMDPRGYYIYVANYNSATMSAYAIDKGSGHPARLPETASSRPARRLPALWWNQHSDATFTSPALRQHRLGIPAESARRNADLGSEPALPGWWTTHLRRLRAARKPRNPGRRTVVLRNNRERKGLPTRQAFSLYLQHHPSLRPRRQRLGISSPRWG